ncbi:MAG: hypothetical protein P8164_10955 [Gammaproteobacteria bacterium]
MKMKRMLKSLWVLSTMLWAVVASAKGENLGVGLMVGAPTGLSLKAWQDSIHAIDVGLGWTAEHNESFHLHADYLFHDFSVFKPGTGRMPLYYGMGGTISRKSGDNTHVGIRVPFGISYFVAKSPLEIFGELAPRADLSPSSHFTVDAALGIRFYFE